jgi:hypothetical protein
LRPVDEFASEVVDRLEYLCETESGIEKVMPFVVLWKASCTQSWDLSPSMEPYFPLPNDP